MKTFEFFQPKTLKEATSVLKGSKQKTIIYGGGTDLLSLLKNETIKPDIVVNLKKIPGLEYITIKDELKIGALTKIAEIASNKLIKENFNILSEAANQIASPQLRNMGTLGGNLCQKPRCWYYRADHNCIRKGGDECFAYLGQNKYHCIAQGSPCYIVHPSDMAVALLALGAKVKVLSEDSEKVIPIDELYLLPEKNAVNETVLNFDEIISEVVVNKKDVFTYNTYFKFKERSVWDFAIISIGMNISVTNDIISEAAFAFGGVAPKPYMNKEFNEKLKGMKITSANIESAIQTLVKGFSPLSQNKYKIQLIKNSVSRLLLNLIKQ